MNDLLNMNDRLIERLRRRDEEILQLRAVLDEAGIVVERGPHGITWTRTSVSEQAPEAE